MTKKEIIKILFFNALLIAFLFSMQEFYSAWTHTLSRKPHWKSSKVELEKGVMGAWSFVLTYRALAYGHLDLGTWHGYQEVRLDDRPVYDSLSVDFKLDTLSYVSIFFSKREDTLFGVRLSTDASFPSSFLMVEGQEFLLKRQLNPLISTGKWHTLSLSLDDKIPTVRIDGQAIDLAFPEALILNMLTFRGGPKSAIVDNVRLQNKENGASWVEDFSRKRAHTGKIILLFFVGNLIFIIWKKQRTTLLITLTNLAAITLTVWIFFLVYGQDQYPKEWMIHWGKKVSTIEAADTLSDQVVSRYADVEQERPFRILFLGSSQTWGAGASKAEFTFVQQIERQLKLTFDSMSIQCINAGISGINSGELLSYYQDKWLPLKPDIVLINLSLNDSGSPDFRKNLQGFAALNKERGIPTIFILEPVVLPPGEYLPTHEIMKEVAEEYGLQHIDMHSLLLQRLDDGFLFWDFVHLTNFGQRLFSEELSPYLIEIISTQNTASQHQYQQEPVKELP